MPKPRILHSVDDIIDAFGGVSEMSAKLGMSRTGIYNMRSRNRVDPLRALQVCDRLEGVVIDRALLRRGPWNRRA